MFALRIIPYFAGVLLETKFVGGCLNSLSERIVYSNWPYIRRDSLMNVVTDKI